MRRARVLLTTILAVVVATATSCGLAQRDDEGNVVQSGSVGAQDVQVGDCYNDDPEQSSSTETFEVNSVDAIPCDEPHDNEIYALWDLPDGDFPGEDAVVDQSYEGCLERFPDFVGVAYESTTLDVGIIFPLQETWDAGDREVVCSVFNPAGSVTGTLEGQGETYKLAVEGDCMDESGLAVDCETEHYAEIYLETDLEGAEFPGKAAVDEEAMALCQQDFADFVGTEWEESALDFVYWTPNEQSWDAGFKLVSCAVIDPAGPLTGSVQGSER